MENFAYALSVSLFYIVVVLLLAIAYCVVVGLAWVFSRTVRAMVTNAFDWAANGMAELDIAEAKRRHELENRSHFKKDDEK